MERLVLSDAAWERMAPLIIGRPDQKGSTGRDNRMFVEGVLWIVRTGSPWRDLPESFGDLNSVFRRFSRWSIKGVWWRIFEAMSDDPDFEYLIVDSTIVRAHQHVAGAKKGGAWLGLVPKQMSTGDRTILGSISRRGNRYLRKLFVQAAWVVLVKLGPEQWERYSLRSWIEAAKKRLHHNVLAIALANKLARIAWAVLNKERKFECIRTNKMSPRAA